MNQATPAGDEPTPADWYTLRDRVMAQLTANDLHNEADYLKRMAYAKGGAGSAAFVDFSSIWPGDK
jgi:hypothetical protein